MRRTFDLRIALSTFVLAGSLAGCADSSGLAGPANMGAPPRPSASILDAAHGGTAGFYFLPPLVAQPTDTGVFDATRAVAVTVCPLGSQPAETCMGTSVTVSGPAVVVDGNHYQYNWQTDDTTSFPANLYYRVSVVDSATGGAYGHVDVFLGSSGSGFHSIDQTEFTPLLDGRTVPVKFRIDSGAQVPAPSGTPQTDSGGSAS